MAFQRDARGNENRARRVFPINELAVKNNDKTVTFWKSDFPNFEKIILTIILFFFCLKSLIYQNNKKLNKSTQNYAD